jgi:hypothetical protein
MHAALGFLLILTVHRCYPAGVPRCLQRNLIRRQIRNHSETLCLIWILAILINIPLFVLTKYEKNVPMQIENRTNISNETFISTCETEATEIWSRTYLILLLVLTYLITGIFLIVIYGQVIRIILNSKKYTNESKQNKTEHYRFLLRNMASEDKLRDVPARTSTSSASTNSLNKHQQPNSTNTARMSAILPIGKNKCSTNSHSTQHLQVIIMLFIVILLYILLLLPYRLLNLLFIVYNQLFQYNFMNEILFHWLLNIVRLLVFLNCALQPIIYLIISSRLRQTVIKFFQSCWYKCYCRCQFSLLCQSQQHYKTNTRAIQAYLSQKHQQTNHQSNHPRNIISRNKCPSANNIPMIAFQTLPLPRTPSVVSHMVHKTPYTVTFTNSLRR